MRNAFFTLFKAFRNCLVLHFIYSDHEIGAFAGKILAKIVAVGLILLYNTNVRLSMLVSKRSAFLRRI